MATGETREFEEPGTDGILRGYRWINQIPLNKSHPDMLVNFLDYSAPIQVVEFLNTNLPYQN